MGSAEMDGTGSGLTSAQTAYYELGEKERGMDDTLMKDGFLTQNGTFQGSLSVPPEKCSDALANRQPYILPKNTEINLKDVPSTVNGGLMMVPGSYCTQANAKGYVAPAGPNASSGFSTSIVTHAHDIKAPMTVTAACRKQSVWISQKPPNYQVRNFEASKEPAVPSAARVARPPADSRGKSQLLPRYWPRVTDQELQSLTLKDSNCTVTPLFEKVLSASDAGKVGRLVLPKACAEAYFPPISQAEGVPLPIQDISGKEWGFQFRFWPNNNSRMYVLEGITPCIQSMRLQAGDTVIFSRIEPGGKLMMGYRKAPHVPTLEESRKQAMPAGSPTMTAPSSGGVEKYSLGSKRKEPPRSDTSLPGDKRKAAKDAGAKSKKKRSDTDSAEFKKNWLEAQRLLQSPPNVAPNIVTIEGYDFEEYEEPPVFGKATASTSSPARSASLNNSQQDGDSSKPDPLSRSNKAVPKEAAELLQGNEPLSGLEALANLATVEENNTAASSLSTATTTKHPRHRPGCSCIVCIQPPSGKGPKHKPNCDCNVCVTVKRRFHTLMLRRKRLQSERETVAAAQKKQLPVKEESVNVGARKVNETAFPKTGPWKADTVQPCTSALPVTADGFISGNGRGSSFSPVGRILKIEYNQQLSTKAPQIDLNIQPEKEDEANRSAGLSMKSLLQSASYPLDTYLKQQGLTNLLCNEKLQFSSECIPVGKKTEDQVEGPSSVLLSNPTTFTGISHGSTQSLDQTTG